MKKLAISFTLMFLVMAAVMWSIFDIKYDWSLNGDPINFLFHLKQLAVVYFIVYVISVIVLWCEQVNEMTHAK